MEKKAIENLVERIMRQTNYTEEECLQKIELHKMNEMNIIREYMGIPLEKSKQNKSVSLNQEIYRQIRHKMNTSMDEYNKKKENEDNK
jgi:hypothetical protein